MDIYVLDKEFNIINVIDTYESFIWTERYIECGDFELYINCEKEFLKDILDGCYLQIKQSKTLMIIEDISTEKPSPDSAVKVIVTGRCLKSILYRRIIWGKKAFLETAEVGLYDVVNALLQDSIINPQKIQTERTPGSNAYTNTQIDAPERKISNFIFPEENQSLNSIKIKAIQFDGDNLGEAIINLCNSKGVGLKVEFEDGNFICNLFVGIDRSYNQDTNDYVVFSPDFDNLANTNFKIERKDYCNTAIIVGTDNMADSQETITPEDYRIMLVEGNGSSGLERREVLIDCASVSDSTTVWDSETGQYIEDEPIDLDDYMNIVSEKGKTKLKQYDVKNTIEGEIVNHVMYEYGVDYFLGDIVQTEDEFGNGGRSIVSEFIICQDANGFQTYPTFTSVEEKEDEDDA